MMLTQSKSIFLADDDIDDCFLFEDALREVSLSTHLSITHDGVELMQLLNSTENLPSTVFLDLNMPRKNGFQCLAEIKQSEKLMFLDVAILSTSLPEDMADQLFKSGAKYCIRKPSDFNHLKGLIDQVLSEQMKDLDTTLPEIDETKKFMLSP
jgi:DNA-binding NtrC family response regulator